MRSLLAALALCATLAVLASCASTQPSRFYLLSDLPALETADPVASVGEGLTIGIGPITLPKYLERPQIATRANRHELRFAEFERWAEPLDANVARALADHLARLMPRHRLLVFPWPRGTPIAYQVTLEVTHFFGTVGGESVLLVDWSLSREEEKATLQGAGRGAGVRSAGGRHEPDDRCARSRDRISDRHPRAERTDALMSLTSPPVPHTP
jgi:hypothetical protein